MLNKPLILICGVILSLFITACNDWGRGDAPPIFDDYRANPIVQEVEEKLGAIADGVGEQTTVINEETGNIIASANEIERETKKLAPKAIPHVNDIRESVGEIGEANKQIESLKTEILTNAQELSVANSLLAQMEEATKTAQSARISAEKDRDKAVADKEKALDKENAATRKMLRWLIVATVIGGGAGIALIVYGQWSVGSLLLAGSGSILVLAIVVERYLDYIAIGGLVLLAAVVVGLIWQIFIRDRAMQEVVETTEIVKRKLPVEERKRIFGYREEPGVAYGVQSTSTEKLVNKVRKKFRKKWEHVVGDDEMDQYEQEQLARQRGNSVASQ